MNIRITGIDTTDQNAVDTYVNTTVQLYNTFRQWTFNIIDATTLEVDLI